MSSEQNNDHLEVLYTTISLICQTLFSGVYAALIPLSTHFLLKRKTMSRANKFMFALTIFMFLLSTAFWASPVANLIATVNVFYASSPDHSSVAFLLYPLFNALILVNYIVTDSVVVWRAWVLCRNSSKVIFVNPFLFLACTSLSILTTIGIRVATSIKNINLDHAIDISQITNLVLSLITNISATSIVGFRAWQHRQAIRDILSRERETSTKVERILTLLIESGLIYCVSGVIVLVATPIRLPFHTLGDIYTPVHVQVAGIYPTVVLILVSQQRSLKEVAFSTAGHVSAIISSQIEAMNFRSNRTVPVSTIFDDESSPVQDGDSSSSETASEDSTGPGRLKEVKGN